MFELITRGLFKRYDSGRWILRDLNLHLYAGKRYGIAGGNGSGKSTLISLMAGLSMPTKGEVSHCIAGTMIEPMLWHRHMSMAAPYADLFDYLNVLEILEYSAKFKPWVEGLSTGDVVRICKFEGRESLLTKQLSSGMKQRLRLGMAILTQSNLLLLDEPLTNLDQENQNWFEELIARHSQERCVVIASNDLEDFARADEMINL
ncbi:MAG: ABC transporter ATP-binding protein [Saprospiraceae bacterium]